MKIKVMLVKIMGMKILETIIQENTMFKVKKMLMANIKGMKMTIIMKIMEMIKEIILAMEKNGEKR